MDNVVQDQTPDAGNQSTLFPEDDGPGGGTDFSAISQQLMAIQPDQLTALATSLDPDVRANLAQALFAAMSPDEKQMVDTTPAADVAGNMDGATPMRPEQQYQMSIVRKQKQLKSQDGMQLMADDHLARWRDRITSLSEDGYFDDAETKKLMGSFAADGENKFSVVIAGGGLLHDDMIRIETAEKIRGNSATLGKSVLQTRFSSARPIAKPKRDGEPDEPTKEELEQLGTRLSKMV